MRTFAIIVGTILVVLLISAGGYWVGTGGLDRHDGITAAISGDRDLELTSRHSRTIHIAAVRFNNRCTVTRFKWFDPNRFYWVTTDVSNANPNAAPTSIPMQEGNVVWALFSQYPQYSRQDCGFQIVKAEVFTTDDGTYVFRNPEKSKAFNHVPMVLESWYEMH